MAAADLDRVLAVALAPAPALGPAPAPAPAPSPAPALALAQGLGPGLALALALNLAHGLSPVLVLVLVQVQVRGRARKRARTPGHMLGLGKVARGDPKQDHMPGPMQGPGLDQARALDEVADTAGASAEVAGRVATEKDVDMEKGMGGEVETELDDIFHIFHHA